MTLGLIIAQAGNLGLSSSNSFLAARNSEDVTQLVRNSACVVLLLGFITAASIFFVGEIVGARLRASPTLLWCVCVIAPAMLFSTLGISVLIAAERFVAANGWQIVAALMSLVGTACALLIDDGPAGFLFGAAAATAVGSISLYFFLTRNHVGRLSFDRSLFRKGMSFATKAYIVVLLGVVLQRSGVIVLTTFGMPDEIGLYSVAMQITDVMLIAPTSLAMVLFPSLVKEPARSWHRTRKAMVSNSWLSMGLSIGAVAVSGPFIEMLFGAAFRRAYWPLLFLLPSVVAISILSVLSQYLAAERFPAMLILVWTSGVLVAAIAGSLLVRQWGSVGVAAAQSAGTCVVCAGAAWLAYRRRIATGG